MAAEQDDKQIFWKAIFDEYEKLTNGDKASIRRTVEPDDLQMNPAFYRLIQNTVSHFEKVEEKTKARDFFKNLSQVARLVYFMPFIQHQDKGKSLGALLKDKEISERRLFLVMRSDYPEDLKHLRRLCQQFKGEKVDGIKLGDLLFWWGKDKNKSENSKRRLMQNFYLSFASKENEAETTELELA